MGNRRAAREYALKILYQKDITRFDLEDALNNFWPYNDCPGEVRDFTEVLVRGTVREQERIDSLVKKYSEHWMMDRIGKVERNIIRFAIYELMKMDDIPPNVTINEAIEIAKKFGTKESAHFVNGILDRIQRAIQEVV